MLPYFRFHHIGVATYNIQKTSVYYIESGYKISDIIYEPSQRVNICFLTKEGEPTIELLEPLDELSPNWGILKKTGVGPYHMCYTVDNMLMAQKDLKKKRFIVLSHTVGQSVFKDRKVCFCYNKDVGLIELIESVDNKVK